MEQKINEQVKIVDEKTWNKKTHYLPFKDIYNIMKISDELSVFIKAHHEEMRKELNEKQIPFEIIDLGVPVIIIDKGTWRGKLDCNEGFKEKLQAIYDKFGVIEIPKNA